MSVAKSRVMGVGFAKVTLREAVDEAVSKIKKRQTFWIITANPETIMLKRKDNHLESALSKADMVVADGIGIVWAAKILGEYLPGRIPGIDLARLLLQQAGREGWRVYFLGGKPGVAKEAAKKMKEIIPGLSIAGVRHGYFTEQEEEEIIGEIIETNTDLLLVGMGMPRQEKWILNNIDQLSGKTVLGIGGSLDVFSGKVKRAPELFQRLNLEWLYRICSQPARLSRAVLLPLFVLEVAFQALRRKHK